MTARAAALRLLSRREYTTFELREKLHEREFSSQEIDEALQSLTTEGLVDDRRAAASHVRTASQIKGRGRLRIQRELEARGVDRVVVRELLADLAPADDTAAIARFLNRKRLPPDLDPADRRRVFAQLLRRGFPADAITKALRGYGKDDE